MLAGVRNVAIGATIVMAGLLAVMMAERAWMFLFLSDTPVLCGFFGCPALFTGPWWWFHETWTYVEALASGYTESLIGVAVMIWLVGRMVRRASKSIAAGR